MSERVYGGSGINNGDFEATPDAPWSEALCPAGFQPSTVQFVCRQCGPVTVAQITEPAVIVVDDLVRAHIRGHQETN